MSLFSRRQEPRLEDAIAELAAAQRGEPITTEDRISAAIDAMHGASDLDMGAAVIAILSLINSSDVRNSVRKCVQDMTWGDVQ